MLKKIFDFFRRDTSKLTKLTNQASAGSLQALFSLAEAYTEGDESLEVKINISKALDYYRKAAKDGNSVALYKLGHFLVHKATNMEAEGIEKLKKAAEKGHKRAQTELEIIYHAGTIVPVNYSEEAKVLKMKALSGDNSAQEDLGDLFASGGNGLKQDLVEAFAWHSLSLGRPYKPLTYRYAVEDMTPEEIARGKSRLKELLKELYR